MHPARHSVSVQTGDRRARRSGIESAGPHLAAVPETAEGPDVGEAGAGGTAAQVEASADSGLQGACGMTAKPTRPVPGKTGRKPKLVMLNRVTYRKPGVFLGSNAYFKTFMRFTVRACIFKTSERFAIWDTKRGDW